MPEISRFFGIVIQMYSESGSRHKRPHFHAYYGDYDAIFGFDNIELISGNMPNKQKRMVLKWAKLHKEELDQIWDRLKDGRPSFKIEPLR